MNFILIIIKNIKNLIPYLSLIAVYFLFINIEARKINENYSPNENKTTDTKRLESSESNQRINIPVIPYTNE